MERPALCLDQLGTNIRAMARPTVEHIAIATVSCELGHLILTVLERGKELQTSLDVFVKTLK